MKQILYILIFGTFLIGCNSVKRNQQHITKGNYDKAINIAVKKLQKDKTSSKSDAHILLLKEAFAKAVEQDKNAIKSLQKRNTPEKYKQIYYLYKKLDTRQNNIKPLLPLYSKSLGKNAKFKIVNYQKKLENTREDYAASLYETGNTYLSLNTVLDARKAHKTFKELESLIPNYKNTSALIENAYFHGTDFVLVSLENSTFKILPHNIEEQLLSFNTSEVNDFWTEYHRIPQNNISYNFGVHLNFTAIEFSPERISEKEYRRTKRIKDGWEYLKDRNGNFVLDENGNKIKKDIYKTISATLTQTIQTKLVLVKGEVHYTNFKTNRIINHFPLESEFIFENIFCTYRGDKRALTREDLANSRNKYVRFPTNEQLFIDAEEGIKSQLITILKNNNFR